MLLISKIGSIRTFKLLARWPAFGLISSFSPIMFCTETNKSENLITVSFKWSLVNVLVSFMCAISGILVFDSFMCTRTCTRSFVFSMPLMAFSFVIFMIIMKAKCCGHKIIDRTGLQPENLEIIKIDNETETERPIPLEQLENYL